MSIIAPPDTRDALGGDRVPHCESRSLFKDRFADPRANDKDQPTRKEWFVSFAAKKADFPGYSEWLPPTAKVIYARLMARLMVDLASGVMENANLNLDRYGLPQIPGSAVKGCARRMALQALHDWIAAHAEAGSDGRPAADDACAPCCDGFANPVEMLAAIARIFGWTKDDWKPGNATSDFAWACGNSPRFEFEKVIDAPHQTFAGSIAFLTARPNRDPGLELDVLTPHHTEYYEGKQDTATDTEDPIPVFFPAVKPQPETDYFAFGLIPLRLAREGDLAIAARWLASGLELFGLGAKTAAGYGWFDASPEFNEQTADRLEHSRKAAEDQKAKEIKALELAEQDREAREKRAEARQALEKLTPDEQEDWKIAQLSDAQFEGRINHFWKDPKKGGPANDAEKLAIIRALRGARTMAWIELKARAAKKGGDIARAEQAIRALNKTTNKDKMP